MSESRVIITAEADQAIREFNRLRAEATGSLRQLSEVGSKVGGVLASIGAGAAVAAFGSWIKGAIDAGDAAGKLSQKTGIAVKDIAGIELAYQQAGLGGDVLTSSMSKLSKGIVDGSKTFDVLRIKTDGLNGKLKGHKEVLYEVADGFAAMDDGAVKTKLAMELFGKSGADMIPLLNGGSEALREMDAMAQKLGLSMTDDAAAAAENFNDTLDLVLMGGQGVARGIAAELLPTLSSLAGSFLATMTSGDKLKNTAAFLGTGLKFLYTVGVGIVEVFSTVGKTIGAAGAQIVAILSGDFKLAAQIGRQWSADIGDSWASTAKAISTAWDSSGNATVDSMVKIRKNHKLTSDDALALEKKQQQAREAAEKAAGDFITSMKLEASQLGLNAGQIKMMAAARAAAKAPTENLRMEIMSEALALDIASTAWAEKVEAEKRATELQKKFDDSAAGTWEQVRAIEAQIAVYGLVGTAAVDAERVKVAAKLTSTELSAAEAAALESQLAALDRLTVAQGKLSGLDAAKKAREDLNALLDPTKAQTFGEALKTAFGSAGDSMTKLIGTLQVYGIQQAEVDKARKAAAVAYVGDAKGLATASAAISKKEAQGRISSYGDMAGAAKGFFKEGSKGYGALETAEKAFRAFEMAMAIETMVAKSGLLTAFTGLFVSSKATETAATVASIGPDVAASMVKGQAAAAAGVAGQAQGDPYTAWPRMAAMAAAMAALGFLVSGGKKGDTTAKDRQAAAGTGTVFGSSTAKSDSIARALTVAAANSSIELSYTAGMLAALRNIENSLSGLGNLLIRNSGLTGAMAPDKAGAAADFGKSTAGVALTGGFLGLALDKLTGGLVGKITSKILGAIFGGKVTTLDTGITADRASLGSVLGSGIKSSQYSDTKKEGGLFGKDKYSTSFTGLGAEANDQITKVIAGLSMSLTEAGKLLGIGGDDFSQHLQSFVVDIGKISLKGLSGEEIQKQLETVFSKLGDDMAKFAVGGLDGFQKVGEGYLETVVRLATNYANLDSILASTSSTFGATGLASLAARERLIELAGGIDELSSRTTSFADNFLTEAERLAPVQKYVSDQLAAMGLAGITTRDQFKETVLGLASSGALATEAGAKQYAGLLALADAFAKTHAATVALSKSQDEIADERKELQSQLDDLTLNSTALLKKQRDALDESNVALFDQVQGVIAAGAALQAAKDSAAGLLGGVDAAFSVLQRVIGAEKARLTEAHAVTMKALQQRIDKETAAIAEHRALADAISATLGQMKLPGNVAADRSSARAEIQAAIATARASGQLPDANSLKGALSVLGRDSSDQFATLEDFQRDFYKTQGDLAALGDLTDLALTVEQRSLDALVSQKDIAQATFDGEMARLDKVLELAQKRIDILKGIDTGVLSIADAMGALSSAILAAQGNPIISATAGINSAYQSALGRAPDAAGMEYWQSLAGKGTSTAAIVDGITGSPEARAQALYKSVLGRAGDAAGVAFWTKQLASGASDDAVRSAMMQSDEFKASKKVPGFARGGMHIGGLRMVGEDGPELEVTGPSRIVSNRDLFSRLSNPTENSAELIAEVRRLNATVQGLRAEVLATATHTERTARLLNRVIRDDALVTREEAV